MMTPKFIISLVIVAIVAYTLGYFVPNFITALAGIVCSLAIMVFSGVAIMAVLACIGFATLWLLDVFLSTGLHITLSNFLAFVTKSVNNWFKCILTKVDKLFQNILIKKCESQ